MLSTNGGDLSTPWPLVSLLREYCDELYVVVLGRALSAGTLISMSADKVFMTPDSFLSPIDPQTSLMVNGQLKKIGVEDVTSYIEFIKSKVGLSGGAGMEKAFESLTTEIAPTTIGSLYRTHALIRSLASKMLNTRKNLYDTVSEKRIVENLTEKLFSHDHLISRSEAKNQVGLDKTIEYATDAQVLEIDKMVEAVNKELKLDQFFDPVSLLNGTAQYQETVSRAVIFTKSDTVSFKSEVTIAPPTGQNGNINVNNLGWIRG